MLLKFYTYSPEQSEIHLMMIIQTNIYRRFTRNQTCMELISGNPCNNSGDFTGKKLRLNNIK